MKQQNIYTTYLVYLSLGLSTLCSITFAQTDTPPKRTKHSGLVLDNKLAQDIPPVPARKDRHFLSFRTLSEFTLGNYTESNYDNMAFGAELGYAHRLFDTPFVLGADVAYSHLGKNARRLPTQNWRYDYFFTEKDMTDPVKPGYVESRVNTHWFKSQVVFGWQPKPTYEIAVVPMLLGSFGYMQAYSYHDYTRRALVYKDMRTTLPQADFLTLGVQGGFKVLINHYFMGLSAAYTTSLNQQPAIQGQVPFTEEFDYQPLVVPSARLNLVTFRLLMGVHW